MDPAVMGPCVGVGVDAALHADRIRAISKEMLIKKMGVIFFI
jgi:hypothetical protein